jgi:hypothetical protein
MRRACALWFVAVVACAGCAIEQEISRTPRTAVEQVLLTQAIERALANITVDLPERATVDVTATSLDSDRALVRMRGADLGATQLRALEISYVRNAVAAALGRKGYRTSVQDATYLVQVMVQSLGTMQGLTFLGMPPVESVIIPFSLPELTIYKAQKQRGHARLHMDLFDKRTGEMLGSTPTLIGRTYHNQYTVFFYLTWYDTDLPAPP